MGWPTSKFQVQSILSGCSTLFFTLQSWVQGQAHWKTHRNTATHHTQTFSLNTFTHKVQVSASRTAIGAVLPIDVIVFRLFFSKFHIYISRYIHLLSVQGLAGTVLSPSSSFHSVRKTTLFFLPTLPWAASTQVSDVPPLASWKHKWSSPPE